jgi:hypothetical protein
MEQIPDSLPTLSKQMKRMNRGVLTNVPKETIAKAIWEGQAIMGTDGSVRDPLATYSFVISLSQIEVETCAKGGGFLPTTAKYLDHYSQRTEAAALLAGLCWIKALLTRFPNHTHNNPPSLPIPIDNKAVVTDVNRTINLQTPTFDLLSPDYDILQAIRETVQALPIQVEVFHVKSHQDRTKQWEDLNAHAQINVLADEQAERIYHKDPGNTGIFPTWVTGTRAALFHDNRHITKGVDKYIRDAKHTPAMRQYHIRRSHTATGREKSWDEDTYETIDWKHFGETFKKLSLGRRIQISKYTNDLLPTNFRLQTFDNTKDGRCFACNQLWEITTHVLTCSCEPRQKARQAAQAQFKNKLSKLHTPDIMTNLICTSMDSWLSRRPVQLPTWHGPQEPIHAQLRLAFRAQAKIGWDQFFRGRIAKAWHRPIAEYYKIRQPGESYTADQWMRSVIKELWELSINIWKQRNTELHGTDSALSLERRRKDTATEAENIYENTIGKVSPTDSNVLHHSTIDEIIKWSQEHLDAYLASADIIIVQRDEAAG